MRKVTHGVITTVTDNSGAAIPAGNTIAVDPAGNLYTAINSQCTFKIPPGIVSTITVGTLLELSAGVVTYPLGGPPSPLGLCASALGNVGGLATDSSGNLFIANGARIAKLSNGHRSVVAGTGAAGFSGDNGPATSAQLSNPSGVFLDSNGAIWIADTGNQRIRKVVNGVITTVAGSGIASIGGDGGPALLALLNNPRAIVVDSLGEAYVADTGNNRIRALIPSSACSASVRVRSNQCRRFRWQRFLEDEGH